MEILIDDSIKYNSNIIDFIKKCVIVNPEKKNNFIYTKAYIKSCKQDEENKENKENKENRINADTIEVTFMDIFNNSELQVYYKINIKYVSIVFDRLTKKWGKFIYDYNNIQNIISLPLHIVDYSSDQFQISKEHLKIINFENVLYFIDCRTLIKLHSQLYCIINCPSISKSYDNANWIQIELNTSNHECITKQNLNNLNLFICTESYKKFLFYLKLKDHHKEIIKKKIDNNINNIFQKILSLYNCNNDDNNNNNNKNKILSDEVISFIENEICGTTNTYFKVCLANENNNDNVSKQLRYIIIDFNKEVHNDFYINVNDINNINGKVGTDDLRLDQILISPSILNNDIHDIIDQMYEYENCMYTIIQIPILYDIKKEAVALNYNLNKPRIYYQSFNDNTRRKELFKIKQKLHKLSKIKRLIINDSLLDIPIDYLKKYILLSKYSIVYKNKSDENNKWQFVDVNDYNIIYKGLIKEKIKITELYRTLDFDLFFSQFYDSDFMSEYTKKIESYKQNRSNELNKTNVDYNLGKLNFNLVFDYRSSEIDSFGHRAGWKNVIYSLCKVNNATSLNNIKIIDFIEKTFGWEFIDLDDKDKKVMKINYDNKMHEIDCSLIKKYNNFKMTIIDDVIVYHDGSRWLKILDETITKQQFYEFKSIYDYKIDIPWIGILHYPYEMPEWFGSITLPQKIITNKIFTENIKNCRGIITLSKYLADWLKNNKDGLKCSDIPISVLYHPTDDPIDNNEITFSFDNFLKNDNKCIIQIGYWLRRMYMIGLLKTDIYKKIWLYGNDNALLNCIHIEKNINKKNKIEYSNMEDVLKIRFDNDTYDYMLSENICFINVYDSSANNAVIECIARNTPCLINKHPAVVEYFGEEYPFYYETIKEAEYKLHDFNLIEQTYLYLKNNKQIHNLISYKKFVEDFMNCEVVKNCEN